MMKQNNHLRTLGIISLIFLVLMLAACETVETGPLQTKSEVVEQGNAEKVQVNIDMGVGELSIGAGAAALLDAEFNYNVADWEPEVDYTVNGDNGRLTISQPSGEFSGIPDGDVEYTWNLLLNEDVPLEMEVKLGAGENNLDLHSLMVESLVLDTGAGQTTVRLGGSPLRTADINAGVGEVTLDLTGDWDNDANISIESGVGEMTVVLPDDVGVVVNAEMGIGDLNANGFRIEGGQYVNDAYGESEITLSVNLQGGVGEITIRLAE